MSAHMLMFLALIQVLIMTPAFVEIWRYILESILKSDGLIFLVTQFLLAFDVICKNEIFALNIVLFDL